MAGTWTVSKFQSFAERVREDMNLETDTFELTLTNVAPTATSSVWADESSNELADGNGYSGAALTASSSQSAGAYAFTGSADITFTASGGTIGPFQYFIIRNTTLSGEPLMFYGTRDTAYTIDNGGSLELPFNAHDIYTAAA